MGAPGAPGLGALLHGCCVPLRPGGPTVPYRRPRASRCSAEAPGDGRRPAAGEHRHAERRGKSLSSLGCPGLQPNSRGDAQPLRPTRISLTRTCSLPPPPGGAHYPEHVKGSEQSCREDTFAQFNPLFPKLMAFPWALVLFKTSPEVRLPREVLLALHGRRIPADLPLR